MISYFRPALILFLLLTLLTGVAYPLVVTGLAQLIFPEQANGSLLIDQHGNPVGSKLIGQVFHSPGYFWSRPSATSPYPYNAGASSGSNLGPVNPLLKENVRQRIEMLKANDPSAQISVPVDLATASASGLDPNISPASAYYQIKRVALNRNLSEEKVRKLVDEHTEQRQWGLFGELRVNVLLLNRALDGISKAKSQANVK